jgi:hypothetical protein
MRSSLVFAALGISIIACNADESRSAKSDWQCAPKAVRNGETVTCTASAQEVPREVASNDPPGGGALFVRTFGVPAGSGSGAPTPEPEETAPAAGSSGGATPAPPPVETDVSNPGVPSGPDEYDCSVGGKSCPPPDALPPPPAPPAAGGAPDAPAAGSTTGAATDYRCKTDEDKTTCTRKTIECKAGTMQVGEECLAPGEAPTAPSSGGCTLTQGYWKNHASRWPTQILTIGGVTYTQSQLLAIFNTPTTGDASLILGHQLIAAMLNAANGAGQAEVSSAIAAAQAWMSANKDADGRIPYGVDADSAAGAAGVAISAKLDTYNNGGLDVPHCK